jgi:enoyl-CoA hydratase/carnithine racemase
VGSELIVEQDGHVVRLTLNRPEQRNAVTPELIEELLVAFDRVDADPDARVAILAGAGSAFCAGFDIHRIEGAGGAAGLSERLCSRVRSLRVPVVAKVNGVASGTGCDLAVSCDLRIASEAARFQMPPVKLGVLYETGGMARLVQTVGAAFAREMLLSGEPVDAARALAVGLVNRLVPADRLDEETEQVVATIAGNAPLSVAASKLAVNAIADGGALPGPALAELEEARRRVWASEDSREGPRAFRERRPPEFRGS